LAALVPFVTSAAFLYFYGRRSFPHVPHSTSVLPERPYYSVSQLRTFYSDGGCSYKYHLKYELGFRERLSSAAFLGRLAHQILQQAYYGIPLDLAHRRVWQQTCGPIFEKLQAWHALDEAYHQSGNPNTKARRLWTEQHPQHVELAALIEAYRDEHLTEEYTWAKSVRLTAYYRWSCTLVAMPLDQLLLPDPVLVEGQPLVSPDGKMIRRFEDERDQQSHYTLLYAILPNGITVAGVPDVFAVDTAGVARVADYKVMSSPMPPHVLAEDGQLTLYVELLRQAGYIAPGQKVLVGHLYLTERDGVQPVWVTPSPSALPRLALQLAHMDRHIKSRDFLPVRGIATGKSSPCLSCELAYACRASFDHDPLVQTLPGENYDHR
jgi:hypothetical protein